ncbi:hypothetical protein [Adhaeretor mobilis]|uniref:Uncharacterized protein n=1 Tax=Adhaeretor mobilis TaxID=1930276 RepID=A0A517MZR4_9BACT|nr:hypothetical protein [Adhaeretor mobilis]QDT00288.1 hypothetical protein HG15A2_36240 [Adhaeretor mobilis]
MAKFLIAMVVGTALALVAGVFWRRWRKAQLGAKRQLAMLDLRDQLAQMSPQFLKAAAATGKPRGLAWKTVDLHEDTAFATERVSGELYAMIDATVSFTAIEGGGMEEVEAVSNLRSATAVFVHRNGRWDTDGRVVFNLDPSETVAHYEESLEPVSIGS